MIIGGILIMLGLAIIGTMAVTLAMAVFIWIDDSRR